MLASLFLPLLGLAATTLAGPAQLRTAPAAPATRYLFTVTINSAAPIELGDTPAGQRAFQPISGGNFSGPGLQGKVLGGLDYGLTDADGNFNPDVVYLLQTSSGCDILVREKGHAPNVFMLFETGCDDYDWMNGVVAYGKAAQVAGGISVDVWKVGLYAED